MIRERRTMEDEVIPHYLYDMEITHLRNGQLFFPRPNVIEHIINYRSPLYGIQRSMLASEHFELIAIIEGSFDYTGFSCHFRTSYLPNELLWGYAFSSCNSTLSGFDFERFNQVQLIHAQPFWNYQDDDSEKNSPSSSIPSPYLYPKHFSTTSQRESLPRRKSSNDFLKKVNRLETIESIIDTTIKNIPLIDAEDEPNDNEEKVSLKLDDSFVKHVEFE